jgi:pimeloyl-ACP methyl ester carboxylesterase
MPNSTTVDYVLLDSPYVLAFLFHPRPSYDLASPQSAHDMLIPVAEDVVIGGRFHIAGPAAVNILFFHGNGEIVDDYNDLGPLYNRLGSNFLAVDYRGYGNSTGSPTTSAMMADCHAIFRFVVHWLKDNGYSGALLVMGRSLGSASALELTRHYPEQIAGLIIESGFAYTGPLLRLIGVDINRLGFKESQGIQNLENIKTFTKPTLIIHAELDHIIPFSDGQALYDASPAADKRLLKIPYANHNNIFALGLGEYMDAIKKFTEKFQ